jgi:hypothetical protein
VVSGQWPVASEKKAYMDKSVRSYQDLIVWQKAMDLVTEIYQVSHEFPR